MAAAFQASESRTASRSALETARGTHSFEIAGYSLYKSLGARNFVRSADFSVGGYLWCIRFSPGRQDGYVAVVVLLVTDNAKVRARCALSLVDQTTGKPSLICCQEAPMEFTTMVEDELKLQMAWGTLEFMKNSTLEASPYLRNDCLVIECCVTIIKESVVQEAVVTPDFKIQVPPSDLSENLGKLLESEEGSDVTFNVAGEVFHAHKIVLAMRSPVFKAQLIGPVGESNRQCITVEDIQTAVFKALLHFMYTDSLPAMDGLDEDEKEEMVKHLLVVADKYAMERLKLMCESILCERLDVETVATTLALADQHNCSQLKDACVGYINSRDRMDHFAASKGYEHLKRACPGVIVDLWEKVAKSRKI